MSTAAQVAQILLKVGAVVLSPSKPFTWASGIRSPIYCDNRLLLSDPKGRDQVIRSFLKLICGKRLRFDAIAGIATAGIPHASILADRLGKPLVYVRAAPKGHGKQNRIEGQFRRGDRLLVVEDLVSTGGSSLDAVKALRKAGAKVTDCLAIFSYELAASGRGFQKARCRFHPLSTLQALLPVARAKKIIRPDQVRLIERFSQDPRGWLSRS